MNQFTNFFIKNILWIILLFLILDKIISLANTNDKLVPVLTTIFSGFIVILGVFITNYFNTKNQAERLKVENDNKEKERIHQLRKDIYLVASDHLITLVSRINALNEIENLAKAQGAYDAFILSMNKLQLVADIETSKSANILIALFANLYIDSYSEACELIMIQGDIDQCKIISDKWGIDIERNLQKMKHMNESNENDQLEFEILDANLQRYIQQRQEANDNFLKAIEKKMKFNKQLSLKIMDRTNSIKPEVIKFHVLIRRDIFGSEGIEDYKDFLGQQNDTLYEKAKVMISNLSLDNN